jgi:ubiquinone/menaquinone biosynthesis C-methylase UbiE
MLTSEYDRMYRVEDRHWWYRGMEAITRAVLDAHMGDRSGLRILDAGCGTGGAMASYLADYGSVTGVDVAKSAIGYCRRRHLRRLARASVMRIPFEAESFDLVTCFDVIYERQVKEDSAVIGEFLRVLKPGGFLLLRLPAYDWLRGEHDRVVQTARRYTARSVGNLLRRAGFAAVHITYANMLLFPFAAAKRLAERIWRPQRDRSDLEFADPKWNGVLRAILRSEAPMAAKSTLPFGLSVIALATR